MPGPFANFGQNVNSILSGLAPMNYAGGLLSPDEALAAQRQAQLTQGATMLQAAGPSPYPVSLGQGFGSALMRAQAAQSGAIDDTLKRKLVASEIMQKLQPHLQPGANSRYVLAGFTKSGQPVQIDRSGGPPIIATTGQPYTDTQNDPIVKYTLEQGPAGDYFGVDTMGLGRGSATAPVGPPAPGSPQVPPQATPSGPVAPITSRDQALADTQAKSSAQATGTTTGTKTAQAQFDLPRIEQTVNQTIAKIEELKNHPGLPYIVGAASYAPIVAGTSQAAADALAKQIGGKAFLEAYTASLRGSGQISNIEGEKGTAATARLDRAQNMKDFRAALDDYESLVKNDLETARKQANKPGAGNDPLGIRGR